MQPAAGDSMDLPVHEPVMTGEVCALLRELAPASILDATVGLGGHAAALLLAFPAARLLGVDRDRLALEVAADHLAQFGSRVTLLHADFMAVAPLLAETGFSSFDAILADLGMSSFALDDPQRGFSFRNDGPLDMRMDSGQPLSAFEIVNEEPEAELARIIYRYGEDRASRRIARAIVEARRRRPIATTYELRGVIERVLGARRHGGIHPATRTFQALRIAVNREIESLEGFLQWAPGALRRGGRLIVLAYHSLEDRPVKERFRELTRGGEFIGVTGKAMRPGSTELIYNSRARSARLRCVARSAG